MGTKSSRHPGPLSQAIALLLAEAVDASGISQASLGALVNISQSQLSKLLRGERSLTVDELDDICHALGLSIVSVVREAQSQA